MWFCYIFLIALDDGNGEEAHHIHVSIIVDHVAEVRTPNQQQCFSTIIQIKKVNCCGYENSRKLFDCCKNASVYF